MAYTAEKAFELIETAHQHERLAHAFLITGAAGSGKQALAARIIQMVNPPEDAGGGANLFGEVEEPEEKSLDELEGELVRIVRPVGKSRLIKVDDIRKMEKSFYVAARPGKWKVGVILNADRLNDASENAFLKTLEEPPAGCLLLMLTDAPELLLPTVLSRCVKISLIPPMGERRLGEDEIELLAALASMSRSGMGDMSAALTLRAAFSGILSRRKAEIEKRYERALREEQKKYKNTTDSDEWLKEREKHSEAQAASEYLAERSTLIDVLISWVGDVVRSKCGMNQLDFPAEKQSTAQVASEFELSDLLRRMDAVEELRANLETNVQEQLALEVAFLTVFG